MMDLRPYLTPNPYTIEPVSNVPIVNWIDSMRERSGSVVECLTRDRGGCGFEPHRRHCVVSLSKNLNPTLVLDQPRKPRPFITEKLLIEHKESIKQTKQSCGL